MCPIVGMAHTRFRSDPAKKYVPDLFSNLWRTHWRMKFARVDAFCAHPPGENDRSKFTATISASEIKGYFGALFFTDQRRPKVGRHF